MIKASEVNFHRLLGNDKHSQLRVPDYQRGYSWEPTNVQEFFDDVANFAKSSVSKRPTGFYFMGPIVLMPGPATDNYNYVVDGQQRLATFIIFLAVIRDIASELLGLEGVAFAGEIHATYIDSLGPKEGHRYSVLLGDLDQPFFQAFVQKRDRVDGQIPRNMSNGLIKKARKILDVRLRESIETITDKIEFLDDLVKCLTEKVVMIAIGVDGEREAMNVFERINVRGKPLSESDLIRHRLISSSPHSERSNVRRYWDELEKLLGTSGPTMDVFLRHMWISRYSETTTSKLYDEISDHLDQHEISPLHFANDCVNDCRIYSILLNKEDSNLHFDSKLSVWAIITTFGAKYALPVLLSAYRKFEKTPEFSTIARAVESLIIRHQFFADLDSSALQRTLNNVALLLSEHKNKQEALKLALDKLASVSPDTTQMVIGVKRPMNAKKREALYILRQLEDHYSNPDGALMAHATLEHIFPKKASPPRWSNHQVEILKPYLEHIGNLALLAGSGNSSASNTSFSKKKAVYRESSLQLTAEIAEEFQSWGKSPLLRRAERLARLANDRWKILN
ncbi:MAG: DUF262 domain-containing HNH endonuclease family protein [Gammaproteobacteria bacterium]|nr:DUF262 domain-containing protein [Pseudomonadales bacterium]